ncbi:hypothetical protein TNCV_1971171 [Trichonephila clavipes]|uniref:Uncharacterized protein n=1 Tax=Trichonephila clavipes TaxID=2585209 RepID=A0A8X6W5C6_TRICX|nr:hypothetical protein TNCV_1971171 [Trichonephila clavipes]
MNKDHPVLRKYTTPTMEGFMLHDVRRVNQSFHATPPEYKRQHFSSIRFTQVIIFDRPDPQDTAMQEENGESPDFKKDLVIYRSKNSSQLKESKKNIYRF